MRRVDVTVLVSIAIIVILLAISGLIRIKESERYVQCKQNLNWIGIALLNYQETYESFPPGTVFNPELPPEQRLSWFAALIPYIEPKTSYVNIDKTEPWNSEKNLRIIDGPFKPLLCSASLLHEKAGPGLSSYFGIAGLGKEAASLPRDAPSAGVFGYERSATLQDIQDGQALTMMVAETLFDNGPWAAGGGATVRGIIPADAPLIGKDRQLGSRHSLVSILSKNYTSPVNILFVDGSVRLLTMTTESKIVEAMATIAEHGSVPK